MRLIALLLACATCGALCAQVESFASPALPSGWTLTGSAQNLWAVDGAPGINGIAASRSGAFSLNFNNGIDCQTPGLPNEGGALSPVYDITYAQAPMLRFWELQHFWWDTPEANEFHTKHVRVWNAARTTLLLDVNNWATGGVGTPLGLGFQLPHPPIAGGATVGWRQMQIPLLKEWGAIKVEFWFGNPLGNDLLSDMFSVGWFIDDFEITGLGSPWITITTPGELPALTAGAAANTQLGVANALAPVTYTLADGALPPGLSLSATGLVSGVAASDSGFGRYGFTVRARDSTGAFDDKMMSLNVARAAPASAAHSLPFVDNFYSDRGWTRTLASGAPDSLDCWQRGYAQASQRGSWPYDLCDPALDRSATPDNMLLGVNIGGPENLTTPVNEMHYIESPAIDASAVHKLQVSFWRYMSSYGMYRRTNVQYFHINGWVTLWESSPNQPASFVTDGYWTQQLHAIDFGSAFGPANFKLRFGVGNCNTGAPQGCTAGGWNIDDLRVIEAPVSGVLELVNAEWAVESPQTVGSTPRVFVGSQYPVRVKFRNASAQAVQIDWYTQIFTMVDQTNTVGTVSFALLPVIPAGAGVGTTPPFELVGSFDCTRLPQFGSGTSIQGMLEFFGREQGGAARALIATGVEWVAIYDTPAFSITTPAQLPNGTSGQLYSAQLMAAGGTQPYTWSSPNLPSGFALSASGQLSVAASVGAGSYSFTADVIDSATPAATAQRNFLLTLLPAGSPLGFATAAPLPNGREGKAYALQFAATGGTPPFTFSAAGLPAGFGINGTGLLTAASPTQGSYAFDVTVTDSAGTPAQHTQGFTLLVEPPLAVATTLLPQGVQGSPYSHSLAAVNGVAPYSWSSGNLPAGLSLGASGLISGVPPAAGAHQFDVTLTDSDSPPTVVNAQLTLNVAAPAALSILAAPLADAVIGAPYAGSIQATGGIPPYAWTLESGALPPGLGGIPGIGTPSASLTGVATTVGSAAFTVRCTDSTGAFAVQAFTLDVVPAGSNVGGDSGGCGTGERRAAWLWGLVLTAMLGLLRKQAARICK